MRVDEDLVWWFCEAAGDLGVRALPLVPVLVASSRHEGPTDRQVRAATRFRQIGDALWSLPHEHQHTLRLAFSTPLPALRARFDRLGKLAMLCVDIAGADLVLELLAAASRKKANADASIALARIRQTADTRLRLALDAYREARHFVDVFEHRRRQRNREARIRLLFGEVAA